MLCLTASSGSPDLLDPIVQRLACGRGSLPIVRQLRVDLSIGRLQLQPAGFLSEQLIEDQLVEHHHADRRGDELALVLLAHRL